MSTKLHPEIAKDMFENERGKDEKSETGRALDRRTGKDGQTDKTEPPTGKEKLERAAGRNDRRNKDNG